MFQPSACLFAMADSDRSYAGVAVTVRDTETAKEGKYTPSSVTIGSDLERMRNHHRREIQGYLDDIRSAHSRREQVVAQMRETNATNSALTAELKNAQKQCRDLQRQKGRLVAQMETAKEDRVRSQEALRETNTRYRVEIAQLQTTLKQREMDIVRLKEGFNALNQKHGELTTDYSRHQRESRERIAELVRNLRATGRSHNIIFEKILASTDRQEVRVATKELLETLEAMKQSQSKFESERNALEQKIEVMGLEYAELKKVNVELKGTECQLKFKVLDLESQVKQLTVERDAIKTKHAEMKEETRKQMDYAQQEHAAKMKQCLRTVEELEEIDSDNLWLKVQNAQLRAKGKYKSTPYKVVGLGMFPSRR